MEYNHDIVEKMLEKSREAFLMALEIYNKPSIRYRIEGFSFFICNAWELMLKAHIVKTDGDSAIYYRDNPNRTITLENCIRAVFTNEHSPIHKNLMRIIELRNTSTHFIVEEYEMVYIPLFQACVFNYAEKMQEFHQIDISSDVPNNFLTLIVNMQQLSASEIRAKYPGQIAERLLSTSNTLSQEISEQNSSYAIRIDHYHYLTKDRSKATDIVHIEKDASAGVQIIKELKDPNNVFKYSKKRCIQEINSHLSRKGTQIIYNGSPAVFNSYHFDLVVKYYKIKEDPRFCYPFQLYKAPTYGYSIQMIDFIVDEIRKDPDHIIENIKKSLKKEKS